ncbi:TRAP transporter small permease [Propionivibrio soli]|uniref:TRAP transporter small permease n=1 Tax=Propionivibrio soli TaxID=2976531 RepID=UPI0021E7B829|nr:TRAP transporter small permease [Propionivibrio soli]
MKTLDKYLTQAMNTIIVVALAMMVIMVFSNVVLRYVFNSGITVSEELARFCFLWLVFVGSVVAMRERAHLGVDSLIARLPRGGKVAFVLISNALMLWVCYLFFVGSWRQTVVGWGTLKPATGIPMAFHYGTGLVMSVGIGIILVGNTWRVLSGKATDAELIQVTESEEVETSEDAETAFNPETRANNDKRAGN